MDYVNHIWIHESGGGKEEEEERRGRAGGGIRQKGTDKVLKAKEEA